MGIHLAKDVCGGHLLRKQKLNLLHLDSSANLRDSTILGVGGVFKTGFFCITLAGDLTPNTLSTIALTKTFSCDTHIKSWVGVTLQPGL